MSYSPSEAVQDEERHLKFLRALAEKYPDARKSDGRWFSNEIPLGRCDFEFFAEYDSTLLSNQIFARLYVELEGGRVYFAYPAFFGLALTRFKAKNPEAYAALLAEVRGG